MARTSKRRPQARLRGLGEEALAVADWASLFGDLARRPSLVPEEDPPVEWRVHDRTHVEFAIDYPLKRAPGDAPITHTWEAYFFVPESFRLHEGTYEKKEIYEDLWSYVRFAVPPVPFYLLAAREGSAPLARVRKALAACAGKAEASDEVAEAVRRLRLFACLVRASGLAAMREVERRIDSDRSLGASFVATCTAVAGAYRSIMDEALGRGAPDDLTTAARWTDEDISLVLETFCASLGVSLEARSRDTAALGEVAEKLASYAVKEARHRRDRGYDSVGSSSADERCTEHFEFRRHMLKRFTASVLWLSLEVRQATTWIVHALYAVAAAAAMAFALAASVGTSPTSASFLRYALPIVVAYAVKDRMKAMLQTAFAGLIEKRFPDRKWSILDRERHRRIGDVHERAGFLPFRKLPPEVLQKRRLTRAHALEEQARPERVLWHQKALTFHAGSVSDVEGDFSMLTEIFRLNLRRWLTHTDDPNRKMVFADPEDALVYQVTTRRVYNINVVYRLRAEGTEAPWHRIRVVVSRKGIERIEPIC
ncbi:Hypothetical protein A7982_00134 [Minicystis rosea]|nr:Hypothetical protein A7982_00134 [Minicystis rosea]